MGPLLILLAALTYHATADSEPLLQYDPATAPDCKGWYDNTADSCDYVRKLFNISPEEFHKWNPSVGLDCEGWAEQSYCIITQEKMDTVPPSDEYIAAMKTLGSGGKRSTSTESARTGASSIAATSTSAMSTTATSTAATSTGSVEKSAGTATPSTGAAARNNILLWRW